MSKKPVPSKKQAVSSTRSRWATYMREKRKKIMKKLTLVASEDAPGKFRLSHHACPHTGKYRGNHIFTPRAVKKGKDINVVEA